MKPNIFFVFFSFFFFLYRHLTHFLSSSCFRCCLFIFIFCFAFLLSHEHATKFSTDNDRHLYFPSIPKILLYCMPGNTVTNEWRIEGLINFHNWKINNKPFACSQMFYSLLCYLIWERQVFWKKKKKIWHKIVVFKCFRTTVQGRKEKGKKWLKLWDYSIWIFDIFSFLF